MRERAAQVAVVGLLVLVGATAGGWWATEQLVRWLHAGRVVYAVEFVNLLPEVTLVEVYCGDGSRALYWSRGVPNVDEGQLYRRYCANSGAR